jgi:hypothetical protein
MNTETNNGRFDDIKVKPWLLILLMLQAAFWQSACGYVAAGAAGAAIGHEVAEENAEDEEDEEDDEN